MAVETPISHRSGPFAQLIDRHRVEILAFLVRLLGNRHDAEDACQDALLRACRAFDEATVNADARAWLFTIATRSAFTVWRRQRRGRRAADIDVEALPANPAPFDDRVELRRVLDAVRRLPPRQQAALMQRMFHDLGYAEIGACLGCSAAAARANVYQALKKLRASLGGEYR